MERENSLRSPESAESLEEIMDLPFDVQTTLDHWRREKRYAWLTGSAIRKVHDFWKEEVVSFRFHISDRDYQDIRCFMTNAKLIFVKQSDWEKLQADIEGHSGRQRVCIIESELGGIKDLARFPAHVTHFPEHRYPVGKNGSYHSDLHSGKLNALMSELEKLRALQLLEEWSQRGIDRTMSQNIIGRYLSGCDDFLGKELQEVSLRSSAAGRHLTWIFQSFILDAILAYSTPDEVVVNRLEKLKEMQKGSMIREAFDILKSCKIYEWPLEDAKCNPEGSISFQRNSLLILLGIHKDPEEYESSEISEGEAVETINVPTENAACSGKSPRSTPHLQGEVVETAHSMQPGSTAISDLQATGGEASMVDPTCGIAAGPRTITPTNEVTSSGLEEWDFGVASDVQVDNPEGNGPHSQGEQSSLQGEQISAKDRIAHAILAMRDVTIEGLSKMCSEMSTLKSENRDVRSQLEVIQTQTEAIHSEFEKFYAKITSDLRVMKTETQETKSDVNSLKSGVKHLGDSFKVLRTFFDDRMENQPTTSQALDEGTAQDVPRLLSVSGPPPPGTNESSSSRQTPLEHVAYMETTPQLFNSGLQGTFWNRPPRLPQTVSEANMTPSTSWITPWQKNTTTSTLRHPNTQGHPQISQQNIPIAHLPVAQTQGRLPADTSGGLATNAGPQSLQNNPSSRIPQLRRRRSLSPQTEEGSRKKPRH